MTDAVLKLERLGTKSNRVTKSSRMCKSLSRVPIKQPIENETGSREWAERGEHFTLEDWKHVK